MKRRNSSICTLVTRVGRHWRLVNGSAFAFLISATSRLLASTANSRLRTRFRWFIALSTHTHGTANDIMAILSKSKRRFVKCITLMRSVR